MYNIKCIGIFILCCIFFCCVFISSATGSCTKVWRFYENCLKQDGYEVETEDQLVAITKDTSYFNRKGALHVLSARYPERAKEILPAFLDDPHIAVRIQAADLLGEFGDKSGLKRMREDFKVYCAVVYEKVPEGLSDKDALSLSRKKDQYLEKALEIGRVLAKLGDYRGYELASEAVIMASLGAYRIRAVYVLHEIVNLDDAVLEREKMDPSSVLAKAVESEDSSAVFTGILNTALSMHNRDAATKIFEKAAGNTNQAEKEQKFAKEVFRRHKIYRDRAKARKSNKE